MNEDIRALALVGAGAMGTALLEGWLKAGLDPARVRVCDPDAEARGMVLARARGVSCATQAEAAQPVDAVVLAVKPALVAEAAAVWHKESARGALIISIAAGTPVRVLEAALADGARVARVMPNVGAFKLAGASGFYLNTAAVRSGAQALCQALLGAVGLAVQVETEDALDAITALSGSGPAYAFFLAEAMAQAGVELGLPEVMASALARATVAGAGSLLADEGVDAAALREMVTSPQGTTAAALVHLMDAQTGLAPLMMRAMVAARARAVALREEAV